MISAPTHRAPESAFGDTGGIKIPGPSVNGRCPAGPNANEPHGVAHPCVGRRRRRRDWTRRLHLRVRPRLLIPDQQPVGVRQLPRHARAFRSMVEGIAPRRCYLQRLSHAAHADRQIRDKSDERLLAFLLLHDRAIPRSAARQCAQSSDR